MTTTITGRIVMLSRLASSTNGNPRFSVVVQDDDGHYRIWQTQADNGFSYAVENYAGTRDKPGPRMEFTLTKAGRIAFGRELPEHDSESA